jgi:hypothetical protein
VTIADAFPMFLKRSWNPTATFFAMSASNGFSRVASSMIRYARTMMMTTMMMTIHGNVLLHVSPLPSMHIEAFSFAFFSGLGLWVTGIVYGIVRRAADSLT